MSSATKAPEPRPRQFRAVIISPHLDDAVFSCGGLIAQLVAEGPVLVVNLFTRYLAEVRARGVVLSDVRYDEEAQAAQLLGFESIRLDALDVSFRHPHYKSLGNIFKPAVDADLAWLPTLCARLLGVLEGVQIDTLYLPLGIGWHVDHMLTHTMAREWPVHQRLRYYEDLPYGLLPHATRLRLADLGWRSTNPDASLADPGLARAWATTARAYARTAMVRNLNPWIVRKLAAPVVAAYLYRLMATHQRAQAAVPIQTWRSEVVPISAQFALKVDAMQCYSSQFREFFIDRADCEAQLRAYAAGFAPGAAMAERYWTPLPSGAMD